MLRLLTLVTVALCGGCGLVDSDITDFMVKFPVRDFNVQSSEWGVKNDVIADVDCPANDCVPEDFCNPNADCLVECNTDAGKCEVIVPIRLVHAVALENEAEFQRLEEDSSIDVRLTGVAFEFTENTLPVGSPALNVYMARSDVTDGSDPDAKHIAVVPSIAEGTVGSVEMEFTATGEADMEAFMEDYETPFKIFVEGDVVMDNGQSVPSGSLVGHIDATATVSIL